MITAGTAVAVAVVVAVAVAVAVGTLGVLVEIPEAEADATEGGLLCVVDIPVEVFTIEDKLIMGSDCWC